MKQIIIVMGVLITNTSLIFAQMQSSNDYYVVKYLQSESNKNSYQYEDSFSELLKSTSTYPKFKGICSFSNLGIGGGLRYTPIKHFFTELELTIVPAVSGGFAFNTTVGYNLKEESSFITGLTYSFLIIRFESINNSSIISPWVSYEFDNIFSSKKSVILRFGYIYDFFDKKFEAPFIYFGFGF